MSLLHDPDRPGQDHEIESSAFGAPVTVDHEALRRLVAGIFAAVDVPEDDADLAADVLVMGELRGVDTHGVANLAPRYVRWIQEGFINPRPRWRTTRGGTALRNVDGDAGLGVVVAARVMQETIEIARETGIAMSLVHNSRHLGMAAYHAMLAMEQGMIGLCTTAVRARMVPTFGREPRIGTNPIAVAVPTGEQPAFVFDAATTTVAANNLRIRSLRGVEAPVAWLVREDGTNPDAPEVPQEPFRLTPLGGSPEGASYKGYGLAAIVDTLGLVLSQATYGGAIKGGQAGHTVAAIDVDTVMPLDEFRVAMDAYIAYLRATSPAAGHDEVLVAGDPQHRTEAVRRRDGIPFPAAAVEWVLENADRFGVEGSADLVLE